MYVRLLRSPRRRRRCAGDVISEAEKRRKRESQSVERGRTRDGFSFNGSNLGEVPTRVSQDFERLNRRVDDPVFWHAITCEGLSLATAIAGSGAPRKYFDDQVRYDPNRSLQVDLPAPLSFKEHHVWLHDVVFRKHDVEWREKRQAAGKTRTSPPYSS